MATGVSPAEMYPANISSVFIRVRTSVPTSLFAHKQYQFLYIVNPKQICTAEYSNQKISFKISNNVNFTSTHAVKRCRLVSRELYILFFPLENLF